MEKVSALMDGELEDHEAEIQMGRSKTDPTVREAWHTYHLIGDALRGQTELSVDVLARVSSRLADEPTVLAPVSRRKTHAPTRIALSVAASLCGIAVVGWLTINNAFVGDPGSAEVATSITDKSSAQRAVQLVAAPANNQVNDYLLAHQEFSPSTAMQGMVSYVRTVSAPDTAR